MNSRLVSAALALGLTVALGASVAQAASDMAMGDPAKGKTVFKTCAGCHSLTAGKNKVGPSLAGIVGREAGTAEGYRYSKAMKESGITWDEESLSTFLANPKDMVPGTKMRIRGVKEGKRMDLIEYLKQEAK